MQNGVPFSRLNRGMGAGAMRRGSLLHHRYANALRKNVTNMARGMKPKKKKIIMIFADQKTMRWGDSALRQGLGEVSSSSRNPLLFPFFVAKEIMQSRRDYHLAVTLRYLNDYPSLLWTVLRLLSEVLTIIVATIFQTKLYWLCHNVDKETTEYYPRITSLRRKMIVRASDKIFVTNSALVRSASQILGVAPSRIDVACFGPTDTSAKTKTLGDNPDLLQIELWSRERRSQRHLVALWVGEVSGKKAEGLTQILAWLRAPAEEQAPLSFIIVGPDRDSLRKFNPELDAVLTNSDRVYFHPGHLDVPISLWPKIADFIFKPLSDLSIPLTLHNAASVHVPYVAFHNTFLGDVVERYRVGYAMTLNSSEKDVVEAVSSRRFAFVEFAEQFSWDKGAFNLFKHL